MPLEAPPTVRPQPRLCPRLKPSLQRIPQFSHLVATIGGGQPVAVQHTQPLPGGLHVQLLPWTSTGLGPGLGYSLSTTTYGHTESLSVVRTVDGPRGSGGEGWAPTGVAGPPFSTRITTRLSFRHV